MKNRNTGSDVIVTMKGIYDTFTKEKLPKYKKHETANGFYYWEAYFIIRFFAFVKLVFWIGILIPVKVGGTSIAKVRSAIKISIT